MANNDGKIYITISDRRFGGNKAEADEQNNLDKDKKDKTLAKFAQHKFFNLIEAQAKQAISYSINNIGNFTGDYIKQQQVQSSKEAIDFLINLGQSAYAGFKLSGGSPWGAVIGAAVAVAGSAINYGEQIYAGQVENRRQNLEINQLRTRAGLNSTNNGSRGTDQ